MKNVMINVLKKIYHLFKDIDKYFENKRKLTKKYKFENRMKNYQKVCFILAGYKEFSYDIVFNRIKEFIPKDIEVCILSSGKYSEKLSEIAKNNDWSYLSTKKNNVALIQNIAINMFEKAQYIFKLDEDIFVTKNYFETLLKTMSDCEKNGDYNVGFVAPTIPINGFGHMLILERFELKKVYEEKFEKPLYAAGRDRMIESNPEVAKFMWGKEKYLPNIDSINNTLLNDKVSYVACPIRFSIGAILFKRDFFMKMGMFNVGFGPGMGSDEGQICSYCICKSKAIIISKNTAVGHLSFGVQNKPMEDFFKNNKNVFQIHNIEGEKNEI